MTLDVWTVCHEGGPMGPRDCRGRSSFVVSKSRDAAPGKAPGTAEPTAIARASVPQHIEARSDGETGRRGDERNRFSPLGSASAAITVPHLAIYMALFYIGR